MPNPAHPTDREARRPLTILFTDIVGSSQFFAERGDTAGFALIRRHNEILMPLVSGAGGKVIKTIGDAILATFDNPGQAARAAWSMQQKLAELNSQASPDEQIHIRIGVHYGMVYTEKGDIFGDAVNMGERVKSQAGAGQVVMSRVVRDLLRADPSIQVRSLGLKELKGSPEPIEIFEVTSAPIAGPVKRKALSRTTLAWTAAGAAIMAVAVSYRFWRGTQPSAPPPMAPGVARPAMTEMARVSLRHWTQGGPPQELPAQGASFTHGDQFQILYRPAQPHYLYAAFFDAETRGFQLVFPLPETIQPARPGEGIIIPAENVRFTLDNIPRTETILLVLSSGRLEELEAFVSGGRAGDAPQRLREALQRIKDGPGSPAQWLKAAGDATPVAAALGPAPAWLELPIEHK